MARIIGTALVAGAIAMVGYWVLFVGPTYGGRMTSPANSCINNLRQIDAAANEFALEHSLTNGDRINFPSDLTPYIKLDSAGKIPPCPSGGVYYISKVGDEPTCSLSNTVTPAHILP
jgi:hypothetical protein